MSGKLYLVGTPIGNLGDLSPRARRTLEEADFIAAEDTRVTLKLLNHFGISKPLVSYYQHNKERSGERILERILAGENCALVTDAGMPAVSDPGEDLAVACAESGVEVTAVPGPCAAVTALAALSVGLVCSSLFQRTVTSTVVSYLSVFALGLVTLLPLWYDVKRIGDLYDAMNIVGQQLHMIECCINT